MKERGKEIPTRNFVDSIRPMKDLAERFNTSE